MAQSLAYGQVINSFNGNIFSSNGIICVNNVCYTATGSGPFISSGSGCVVINGKIYKDGVYLRDMTADDYQKLDAYMQQVNVWTADLQDSIQRSFPWDPRNPSHTQFPWNMMYGKRAKRRPEPLQSNRYKRYMPFPPAPYFC